MNNTRMPNLFVVGAMKAATTSLHNYLALHPDIFMTRDPWKEPGFFVKELNWNKGWDWYSNLFSEAETQKFRGESSTDYTKSPHYAGVPERIHAACPDAKIIYIMRDPIERAISQYWWEVEFSAEGRNMPQGILENPWIMNASHYALQITPYLELFGEDNVFTLTTEALVKEPKQTLIDLFTWLGVSAEIELPEQFDVHNKSKASVNKFIAAGLVSKLKGSFVWDILKKSISPQLKAKLLKSMSRKVEKDDGNHADVVELLRPIMQPQVAELTTLTGKRYDEWTTLFPATRQ
ncbi:MAG: sulfotransferase [Methylococcaceae bacterium]|nr:sulfotransferase [Methylococcaceae bacterium]